VQPRYQASGALIGVVVVVTVANFPIKIKPLLSSNIHTNTYIELGFKAFSACK